MSKLEKIFVCALVCVGIGVCILCGCSLKADNTKEELATTDMAEQTTGGSVQTDDTTTSVQIDESEVPLDIEEVAAGTQWTLVAESKVDFPIFTVEFFDENMGVTVGTAGKAYSTTDGGKNWTKAANDSPCRFGLDILDGKVVYTCGNQGIITKSVDGGVNFEHATDYGDSEPKQCTLMSFCDENTGIAASKGRLGLTTDGGVTWTDLDVPCSILAIRIVDAQNICLLSEDMVLYRTADGGSTWEETQITFPLGDDYYFDLNNIDFSVDGEQAYTFFCIQNSTKRLKCYSTTDNGATFTENLMPDTKMPNVPRLATVKLNQPGDVFTVLNLGNSTIYAFQEN